MDIAEYYKQWAKEHKEHLRAYRKEWARKNKAHKNAHDRAYKEANKEKIRKQNKEYRRTHKSAAIKYKKENSDKHRSYEAKRRTRKTKAGGSFTDKQWTTLCKKYYFKCLGCNRKRKLAADHVVPVSKGGTSDISNIQPLCQPCNSKKGTKYTDFRKGYKT